MAVPASPRPHVVDPRGAEVAVLAGPPPAAVRTLRTDVFVREQGVPAELEHDEADAFADHAVVWDAAGRALATGRLLDPAAVPGLDTGPEPLPGAAAAEPVGVIGRVAARPEARGRGLARAVMAALEGRGAERGLATIRLHAQASVAGLYVGLGYRAFGPRDMTAGIEHVWMARSILPGLRAVRDADGPALERLIGETWAEYPGNVLDVDGEEPWLRAPAAAYAGDTVPGRYRGRFWVVDAARDGDDPSLAGCVGIRMIDAGRAELKSLYVAAGARRRGLGAALVRRVEREARLRHATVVELWTDTRFIDAHRLYERLGYGATGETRELGDLSNTTEFRYTRELPAQP
jgi:predicted GNAT family N-acyltransferase